MIFSRIVNALNKELGLLRNQRLKYLNGDSELKEAVANIAHDLCTPLTTICGYLDLLDSEEKSENVGRYITLIENRNRILEKSIASFYTDLTKKGINPVIHIPEKVI